jgi:hypothetical protein
VFCPPRVGLRPRWQLVSYKPLKEGFAAQLTPSPLPTSAFGDGRPFDCQNPLSKCGRRTCLRDKPSTIPWPFRLPRTARANPRSAAPGTGNRLVDPNSRRRGRPSSPSPRRFPVWKTLVAALSIAFGLVPQGGSPWKAPTPPPARAAAAAAVRSAPSATLAAAPTPADGAACLSFSVAAPCQVPQPAPAAAVVALPTPRPVAVAGPPLVARPAPPARVVWATCWRIVQGRRLTYGCWWNLDTQAPA